LFRGERPLHRFILSGSLVLLVLLSVSQNTNNIGEATSKNDDNNIDEYIAEDFEEKNFIQICCTWGIDLQDGKLTYKIDDMDSSKEQQDAVRNAIEEWDLAMDPLDLGRVSSKTQSDISIEFRDGSEETVDGEEIAGRTVTTFDQYGFLDDATVTVYKEPYGYEFDTSAIEQVVKHEMGHALGLGHANFDGNLMAKRVNDGTEDISKCEIKAVIEANYWKLGDSNHDNTYPYYPADNSVICESE
jgi:predicted Zn-dependent protease